MLPSTQTRPALANAKTLSEEQTVERDQVLAAAKAAGLRLTEPRKALISTLVRRGEPVGIRRLHEEMGTGRCDLVTLYRSLAALEEAGIVRRSFTAAGAAMVEIAHGRVERFRVVCRQTGQMRELDESSARELSQVLAAVEARLKLLGLTEIGHVAEFFARMPGVISPEGGEASRPLA